HLGRAPADIRGTAGTTAPGQRSGDQDPAVRLDHVQVLLVSVNGDRPGSRGLEVVKPVDRGDAGPAAPDDHDRVPIADVLFVHEVAHWSGSGVDGPVRSGGGAGPSPIAGPERRGGRGPVIPRAKEGPCAD